MAAGDTPITVVGNLTYTPEFRITPSGVAVATFTVASNPRQFNKNTQKYEDGPALFMRCQIWRDGAQNLHDSNLSQGTRVVVTGRLKQRSYENREGAKVTVVEVEVEDVGPSVKGATVAVTRIARNGGTGTEQPTAKVAAFGTSNEEDAPPW